MRLPDWIDVTTGAPEVTYDERGNETTDWGSVQPRREPALVIPVSSTEQIVGRDRVEAIYQVTLLPMTTVTPESRVTWRGNPYEVRGDVQPHVDYRGRTVHCSAVLVRTVG